VLGTPVRTAFIPSFGNITTLPSSVASTMNFFATSRTSIRTGQATFQPDRRGRIS
jgi:hypothetical protein